jgi:hypothetical protein
VRNNLVVRQSHISPGYALVPFLVQDISDLNVYPDRMEIVEKSAKRYMRLMHNKELVQEGRGAEIGLLVILHVFSFMV